MYRLIGVALIQCIALCVSVRADEHLDRAIEELAGDIKTLLDGREVAIGTFAGPATHQTNAGPGFSVLLQQQLQKINVVVKAQAKIGIEGRYSLTEVPAENPDDARIGKKQTALKVKLEVVDAFDNRSQIDFERKLIEPKDKPLQRVIREGDSMAVAFGITSGIDLQSNAANSDKVLRQSLFEPKFHLDGSIVRSERDQPFGVEILVDGVSVPVENVDGLAYVNIPRNKSYVVRAHSSAPFDSAVSVLVDGISSFEFSELRIPEGSPNSGRPKYSAYILPRGSDQKSGVFDIDGWHRRNEKGGRDSFLVSEYANSAAAKLGIVSGLGVITVTFRAAWSPGSTPPMDETAKRRGQGDATGFGPPTGQQLKEKAMILGDIRNVISIRYAR